MKRISVVLLCVVAVLSLLVGRAEATNRYVCAAGNATCGGTPAYSTLQAAVTAAVCGDTIFIVPATYNANTNLSNTTDCGAQSNWIVIRSSGSDSNFPATGYRIIPTVRADGVTTIGSRPLNGNTNPTNLATLVGPNASTPPITAANGARSYILKFLRFYSTPNGSGALITLSGSTEFVSSQPKDITIDRVLLEGDPLVGQKRGVEANGSNITVINSYFTNMVGLGQDAQCMAAWNALGPIVFSNNYCEPGGEGVMFGGDRPNYRTFANTSTGSTTTSIVLDAATYRPGHTCAANTLGTATDLIGATIAVQVSSDTNIARAHSVVTAVNCGTNTITVSPALPTAPAAGLDVRWGANINGVTVERNWFYNPTRWTTSIIASPAGVNAGPAGVTGTLTAGTYYYVVAARKSASYGNNTITSGKSQQVTCTLDSTGACNISWSAVSGATTYRVYGRSNGGQTVYFDVTAPTLTFNDTGGAGTAGTPTTNGDRWLQKNLFEIKQCINCTVRYNLFDGKNSGLGGTGSGDAMWIKSTAQLTGQAFTDSHNITISYNVVRNVGGFLTTSSVEETYAGNIEDPAPLTNVVVSHNLVFASRGDNGLYAVITGYEGVTNFVFDNNTVLHNGQGIINFGATTQPWPGTTYFRNNIFIHNNYGFKSDYFAIGTPTITAHVGGGGVANFLNNVITSSVYSYPATTLIVSQAQLQSAFVNYGGSEPEDYDLVTGHAWRTAGTSGSRIGADIPAVIGFTNGVDDGTPSGAPTILTLGIANGTVGVAYSQQLSAAGGTGTKAWTVTGTMPVGLSINASTGLISGTPTTAASYTFTVRVTDSGGFSERPYTVVVSNPASSVVITTTTLPNPNIGELYSQLLLTTGGTGTNVWTVTAGALPTGLSIGTNTGIISGTPTQLGPFTFTITATSGTATDTETYALVVGQTTPVVTIPTVVSWNGQQLRSFKTDAAPTPDDGARSGDLWVDPTGRLCIVTATSPAVTYDCYAKQSEAGGGGGSGFTIYTYRQWAASNAITPATGAAAFDLRNDNTVLAFSDSATEAAYFEGVIPTEYDGGNVIVELRWASVATGGSVRWAVAFEMQNALDIDTNDFATDQVVVTTVPGTSGVLALTSVTLTNAQADAIAAGASFRLRVSRIGADVTDDATGDAQLLRVNLRK